MSDELIFVGYTNGHQVAYAKESEGVFYPDTDNECYIPLYMLKTHAHRIESTSGGQVTFEQVKQPTTADYLEANEAMLTKTKAKMVSIESLKEFAGIKDSSND